MASRLSRRTLLRGLGGVAVALPFLDAMRVGGGAQTVQRYVQMVSPLGMSPGLWYTPGAGGTFTISEWAAALRPHAADMTIVRGLKAWNGADGHHAGNGACFTGGAEGSGFGISLDQAIAGLIDHGPFPSLNLAFFGNDNATVPGETNSVYAGPDRPLSPVRDPRAVFTSLFGGGTATGGEAIEDTHARRRSILDLVRDDFRDAEVGLSSGDKRRLRDHADYLRAVEMSITGLGPSCGALDASEFTIPVEYAKGAELAAAMGRLIALAMACDLTRVASLQFSHAVAGVRYEWLESRLPGIASQTHHGWTHHPSTGDWSLGLPYFREIERWHLEQVGFLVDELKRLDVFEGTSVLWTASEARGPHGVDEDGRSDLCYVLFGDLNGHFRTGQVLEVDQNDGGYLPPDRDLRYRNSVLLAVAQAYGYTGDSFGEPYRNQAGPLTALLA
ncbi:MAG: DUF1552 domain-containing protein [Sandaracinaceae bacterium]